MNCEDTDCINTAELMCNIHFIKLCEKHYGNHCRICKNEAIEIDQLQNLRSLQINNLSTRVALIKSQIVETANNLMFCIKVSVKSSLYTLDQQKALVVDIIHKGRPENQISELLECIPNKIPGVQNSIQSLIDLERILSLREFKAKSDEIERKFRAKEATQLMPGMNSVLESLEKLDLQEKISWCRRQFSSMVNLDTCIKTIKITKDAKFVFICTNLNSL